MSTQTLQFKTELKQLLDIIVHSLYSHRDIFLRELISNASDAIDTRRFQALTRAELGEGFEEGRIKLIPNKDQGTLTIADNGIGMTRDAVIENLGTIAKSGTRALLESLKASDVQSRPELIGQFGVGFYSAFMVADKVTVVTRAAGEPAAAAVSWESTGQGEFQVETVTKETVGTDVTLHLKKDALEFLEPFKLQQLVKQHSDFVEHAIVMDMEKEEDGAKKTVEETLNSRKALWLRPRAQITDQEYKDFYKHLTHDFQDPLRHIHFAAEGAVEFKALLYLPRHKPFDLLFGEGKKGLHLYIRRVFIMDDCEALLPLWLRFVRGVVDSPDLPLNVSREMLQESAPLEKIKSNLTHKLLKTLEEMKTKEFDDYLGFYKEFGVFLKEGVTQDYEHREPLADLLLFESSKTEPGKLTTLADYISRMPEDQTEIYHLGGENREVTENSPLLENFKAKGQEVLFFLEPIDEFLTQSLHEYKGKKLKAIDQGKMDDSGIESSRKEEFKPLLDYFKEKIGDIKEARLSNRLKESAVCLVADEWGMTAYKERILQRLGRGGEAGSNKRILEVNPDHPVVSALQKRLAHNPKDDRVERYCRLLYDQAVVAEGSRVKDPVAFARLINELLGKDLLL